MDSQSISLLIWSEFEFLKCHTVLSYGGGQIIFKSKFAYLIWWWQFECKEACTLESITILGWDVNIKSIQDLELSCIYISYFIICESLNWEVRKSSSEPWKLVISIERQSLDLALKSPIMTVRNGFPHNNASRFNFKFDLNVRNSS